MSLGEYLNSIGRVPLLTSDEEIILGSQVQRMMRLMSEKTEDQLNAEERKILRLGRKAKNRMVSANLRLVVNVAKKFRPQKHMKMEDILQEGALGLMRAVEKFDPERGYKFSTYAYWWIRQGITRAGENQENEIRVPAHIQRIAKQAADAKSKLIEKNGKVPTLEEIAEEIDEPDPKKVQYAIAHQVFTFSLDFRGSDSEYTSLIEILNYDGDDGTEEAEDVNTKMDLIFLAISALDPEDGALIKRRYGIGCEPVSIKRLASEHGLSVQGTRDRIAKVLNRIRIVVRKFI